MLIFDENQAILLLKVLFYKAYCKYFWCKRHKISIFVI